MSPRHSRQIDNVSENISGRRLRESRRRRAQSSFVQFEPNPNPRSRESDRVYSRRLNRNSLIEEANRKRRAKKTLIAAIIVTAAIIVSLTVAIQVFFRTTDARLAIGDSRVSEVLVAPKEDQPFYILCLADLKNPAYAYSTLQDEAAMLVRIDESSKNIAFLSFPTHMFIQDDDDQDVEISTMLEEGDYPRLVKSVSIFTGVDISHLVITDYKMLKSLVDVIGGVDVDIPQEIDDPLVGDSVLRAGNNSLDGKNAMEFIRATNLMGGFEATAKDRALFTEALMSKVLDSNQVELATVVSDAANYVDTDWKTNDILATADSLKPFDSITFVSAALSCSESESDSGEVIFKYKTAELETFLSIVKDGQDPSASEDDEKASKESKIKVEVRNGAGIDGAAATLGAILKNDGYTVTDVGNTNDDTLYPETLVVYTGTGSEEEANAVIRDIGAGRVVEGGDFYTSSANVIVIIGTDWA